MVSARLMLVLLHDFSLERIVLSIKTVYPTESDCAKLSLVVRTGSNERKKFILIDNDPLLPFPT